MSTHRHRAARRVNHPNCCDPGGVAAGRTRCRSVSRGARWPWGRRGGAGRRGDPRTAVLRCGCSWGVRRARTERSGLGAVRPSAPCSSRCSVQASRFTSGGGQHGPAGAERDIAGEADGAAKPTVVLGGQMSTHRYAPTQRHGSHPLGAQVHMSDSSSSSHSSGTEWVTVLIRSTIEVDTISA